MKVAKTLFYFLIFTFRLSSSAQDKLPKLGKIDKADLEMTDCSFDPDASAMLLIDRGEVNYNFTGGDVFLQTDIRQRIKILKEDGISKADIKIDFYSKDRYEEISNLAGVVYNLDAKGNIVSTKLEKSAFYYKDINDEFSEIAIAFPDVKVGTVIEYSYRSYKKIITTGLGIGCFNMKFLVVTASIPLAFLNILNLLIRQSIANHWNIKHQLLVILFIFMPCEIFQRLSKNHS